MTKQVVARIPTELLLQQPGTEATLLRAQLLEPGTQTLVPNCQVQERP
jgi:hypothetical protein